jgi:hypothetical protein
VSGAPTAVPTAWICNASYYDASDGCDCAYGAIDPDCATDQSTLFGCDGSSEAGWSSSAETGECVGGSPAAVPSTWACDPSYYNASDGCDCACGAIDPDCATDPLVLFGCAGASAEGWKLQRRNG